MLLEPIMKLEVVTPEDYLGNVTADLSSRRRLIDKHVHARQADGDRSPRAAGKDVRLLDGRAQPQPGPRQLHAWSRSNTPPRRIACSKPSPGCNAIVGYGNRIRRSVPDPSLFSETSLGGRCHILDLLVSLESRWS